MKSSPKNLIHSDFSDEIVALVTDLTDIILGTDNISAIANQVLDIVVRYTGAGKCSLMLLNERRELSIVASRGINLEVSREYRSKIGQGIAGMVVRNTVPVLVEDIYADETFRDMRRGNGYRTPSFVSCPIRGHKRMIGVLNASDRKDSLPFDKQGFELLQLIGNHTAVALENASLVGQLREKATELEDMNRKLMEGDLLNTEFLTRISHELRTPLNSIKGSVYYLENADRLTREDQKEFYAIISKEAEKLADIVESQLDFLSCRDGMRSTGRSVVSLAEILSDVSCSKTLAETLGRSGIALSVQLENMIPEIIGDKFRIRQMLLTLLEGIANRLERGDELRISAGDNTSIHIKVQADRKLPKQFLASFSRPAPPLGREVGEDGGKMYLVRKAAENLGWDLDIDNGADTFTLTMAIPRSRRQKIDAAVAKSTDLFLEFIAELMGLGTCSIMLRDDVSGELRIRSALGLDEDIVRTTHIRPGDQISGWVVLEGKPVLIENIENDPRFARKSFSQYNTKSLLSVPLKIGDTVAGVLNLNNKKSAEPFTPNDLILATALGDRISSLIGKLRDNESWEQGFQELTASFEKLLIAGRKYHKKTRLLPNLVRRIMERLEASDEEQQTGLYVSAVYDLGLMFMDEAVLRKGKLEPSEFASLKVHPFTTVELLNGIEFSPDVSRSILHHHEKFDGTGYPDGLAGCEIPLISRVISVVDAYCAMISKRPHRKEMTGSEALREIRNGAGTSYDPAVVEALEEILKE